jgi:predicted transcriptional regulator
LVQPEKSRSRLKIYFDILSTIEVEGNAKPTRILYKANLSYDRLTKYLEELVGKGLVQEFSATETRYYTISDKGKELLTEIRKAEAFLAGFGLSF